MESSCTRLTANRGRLLNSTSTLNGLEGLGFLNRRAPRLTFSIFLRSCSFRRESPTSCRTLARPAPNNIERQIMLVSLLPRFHGESEFRLSAGTVELLYRCLQIPARLLKPENIPESNSPLIVRIGGLY